MDYVGNLTGQKYIFPESITKQTIQSTKNLEVTKENAEVLLTNALYQSGLTRIPVGEPNTFNIVALRDAPRQAVPIFTSNFDHNAELPKTWDVVTLKYKARDPEAAAMIPRILQDYLPRTGNILVTAPGYVLITDAAPNLSRIANVIDAFDQKLSPERMKPIDERQKAIKSAKN